MNPSDEQQASSASPLPTGESQTGVVRRPAEPQEHQADGPVLEHRVAVPEEPVTATPAPSEPVAPPPAAVAAPAPVQTAPALQESPKVSIPERMNHLSTENQRLRDELQALEQALKRKAE